MVALRDLSWPHLIPICRPPTAPSTPHPLKKPVSAKNILGRIQAAQQPRRSLSEGGCPSIPPLNIVTGLLFPLPSDRSTSMLTNGDWHAEIEHTMVEEPCSSMQASLGSESNSSERPPLLPEPNLGAEVESPSGSSPKTVDISPLTDSTAKSSAESKADGTIDSYFFLPTLSKAAVENSESHSHAHRPPISPAVSIEAADSAADDSDGCPSSRLSFARFQFGNKASFDTSMAPLVQSRPDSPIGGLEAPPMKKRVFPLGNRVLSPNGFKAPRIEITSPTPRSISWEDGVKPLRNRSNFSDPCYETSSTRAISRPQSPTAGDRTPQMVTAPESPALPADRRGDLSEISYDGPGLYGSDTIIRDFAVVPDPNACPNDECVNKAATEEPAERSDACPDMECASGATSVSPKIVPIPLLGDENVPMTNLDELPIPILDSRSGSPPILDSGKIGKASKIAKEVGFSDDTELPNMPTASEAHPQMPSIPGIPKSLIGLPEPGMPSIRIPTAPSSGRLPAPDPVWTKPKRVRVKGVAKRGVQKSVRMGRRVVLKRPVLKMVVGRKLSGPVADALKLASKGIDFEVPSFQNVPGEAPLPLSDPLPAPVPIPPVPIPA